MNKKQWVIFVLGIISICIVVFISCQGASFVDSYKASSVFWTQKIYTSGSAIGGENIHRVYEFNYPLMMFFVLVDMLIFSYLLWAYRNKEKSQ